MTQSLYEVRLQADLGRIRTSVDDVGKEIAKGLQDSVKALLAMDTDLAYQVILGDHAINRSIMEIDRLCHSFVARHLPSAGHLRFISSVLRMNVELERIGDYAVTICRETVQLSNPLEAAVAREAERLARDSFQMLDQALRAFRESNAEIAKATKGYADQIDRSFANVFEELVHEGQENIRPIRDLFGTLVIFNRLERVSDQAKNICEETVFAATGETKQPKVYRVLFLDATNGCRSQMAVAIARKAYPESGIYVSAGRKPAEKLDPTVAKFMDARGMAGVQSPRAIDDLQEAPSDFHVIVSLDGRVRDYVERVPFRTVALEWKVPEPPGKEPAEDEAFAKLEEISRELAHNVRGLMETLRGPEAS